MVEGRRLWSCSLLSDQGSALLTDSVGTPPCRRPGSAFPGALAHKAGLLWVVLAFPLWRFLLLKHLFHVETLKLCLSSSVLSHVADSLPNLTDSFIVLKCNLHLNNSPIWSVGSRVSKTSIELCSRCLDPVSRPTVHRLRKKPRARQCSCPTPLSAPSPGQSLSGLVCLRCDSSGHFLWVQSWDTWSSLMSFTLRNVFKVHTCCVNQYCILFCGWYCVAWIYPTLLIHSPVDGHLGSFHLSAIMKSLPANVCVQVCVCTYASVLLGLCPKVDSRHQMAPASCQAGFRSGRTGFRPTSSVGASSSRILARTGSSFLSQSPSWVSPGPSLWFRFASSY